MHTRLFGIASAFLLCFVCVTMAYGDFYVIPGRTNYKGVIVVAKSGAKFSSIQAALDSIDSPSDSNRWLIQVAPGVYSERVTMRSYVDIAGSGTSNTTIFSQGSASEASATVLGANNAELRDLTVKCSNLLINYAYTTAIRNDSVSPTLIHIAVKASGGTQKSVGIVNTDNAFTTMKDITVNVTGAYINHGVDISAISNVTMKDIDIYVSGGSLNNIGVYTDNASATMTRVLALPSGSSSYGFYNRLHQTSGYIHLLNVSTIDDYVYPEYGIYNTLGADVRVYNSRLIGSVASVENDQTVSGTYGTSTAKIAGSELSATATGGEFTCVGCYDSSFSSLGPNCQ